MFKQSSSPQYYTFHEAGREGLTRVQRKGTFTLGSEKQLTKYIEIP